MKATGIGKPQIVFAKKINDGVSLFQFFMKTIIIILEFMAIK